MARTRCLGLGAIVLAVVAAAVSAPSGQAGPLPCSLLDGERHIPTGWFRDGSEVEFTRFGSMGLDTYTCHVPAAGGVAARGEGDPAVSDLALAHAAAPDWPFVPPWAFFAVSPDRSAIAYRQGFGSEIRLVDVRTGTITSAPTLPPAAAGTQDGWERTIDWTPDGSRVVYAEERPEGGTQLVELEVATGATRVLVASEAVLLRPTYAPAGDLVAYEERTSHPVSYGVVERYAVHVVGRDGGPARRLAADDPGGFDWLADGSALVVAEPATFAAWDRGREQWTNHVAGRLVVVSLDGTVLRVLDEEGQRPVVSPGGDLVAFAAGGSQRCSGLATVPVTGGPRTLLVPGCVLVQGTADNDLLTGSARRDRLVGRAGDDELEGGWANSKYSPGLLFGFGDQLDGGAGDDRLRGNDGKNVLRGGRGDDVVDGGSENDYLVGGPGRDWLLAGPGRDTIDARDGWRDVISCGRKNGLRGDGRQKPDLVLADPIDEIRPDCTGPDRVQLTPRNARPHARPTAAD